MPTSGGLWATPPRRAQRKKGPKIPPVRGLTELRAHPALMGVIGLAKRRRVMANSIFNTGVDDLGRPLQVGSVDPNWRIIHVPPNVQVSSNHHILVTDQRRLAGYFQTSDSMWVWGPGKIGSGSG